MRRLTFYFALAAIYIRFSVVHEVIASILNLNLYLLYIVMPPALLGAVGSGGIRRMFSARTARYWALFLVWLFLAVPFSVWRGDSANVVYKYAKSDVVMLLVIAGLVLTWEECKKVMITLVLAGVTDLAVGRIFMRAGVDRSDLDLGGSTIANSNDMAVHLVLLMGFLLYAVLAPKIPKVVSIAALTGIAYGVFLILSSGSRGALLALIACVVFSFIMGTAKYRMLLLVTTPVAAVLILGALPRATLARLSTLTSDSTDSAVQGDAEGSSIMRRELLKKSIQYSFERPIFGVGPGQFSSYEGGESVHEGRRGMWHATHNSWTQISSECGLPALLFFILANASAFWMTLKTNNLARANPANRDISVMTFCVLLAMVGFFTAITFANFAYFFYEPAVCGLCIVISRAAQREMAARRPAQAVVAPSSPRWVPPQPSRPPLTPAPSFANKLR